MARENISHVPTRGSRQTPDGNCRSCITCLKWVPVFVIVAIIGWSYYAYVIQLCAIIITNRLEQIFYLLFYHVFLLMFGWAYWRTVFTGIGIVPDHFKLTPGYKERLLKCDNDDQYRTVLEEFARELPVHNATENYCVRFCNKCEHVKPDRAHHCSVCGCCVLKMDHHCPWVNNCVAFTNYKFFILFLAYSLLYCIYISVTTLPYFVRFWRGELAGLGRFHVLFLFFVSIMFAISLVSLFGYHCCLVYNNRTTLESFRAPFFRDGVADKNGFNVGPYKNFQEVFGDQPRYWFLPVYSSLGDGVVFPVQSQHQASMYNSMGTTTSSLGDGITYPTRPVDEDSEQLLPTNNRYLTHELH